MIVRKLMLMVLVWCVAAPVGAQVTIGFEDQGLGPETYADGGANPGGFSSQGVTLHNSFWTWPGGWTSWAGWALSTVTDNQTPGFFNQYSAWPGGGAPARSPAPPTMENSPSKIGSCCAGPCRLRP